MSTNDKTILLMGGDSPEREVSLMSGEMVLSALERLGVETAVFDPGKEAFAKIADLNASRVFNILHGGAGENGEIQGALRMLNLPCTGSGVLASALAMDKHRTKMLWQAAGIPTPRWRIATTAAEAEPIAKELGMPLFVKPSCGGSSTCSSKVTSAAELATAIVSAATEGAPAMIEQFVGGREYTASILDDKPLPLIGIAAAGEFYDYHAKYIADNTNFTCPCGLPAEQEETLNEIATKAFALLGCRHWGRVDFIIDDNNNAMFLEVNTVPGMTSHSLVPQAAAVIGIDYDSLVGNILAAAA
ncbi:MAG: D-alanine--D-alanine ligase [Gammaproteobacteria bacterium WSBS_2016_MAG_OTU1]